MNAKNRSVDWDDLHLFLFIAREGGLSPAARATGRSPATLGRRMHALERALGRDLLIRHDRGYDLTSEGKAFFDDLSRIEGHIAQLTRPETARSQPTVRVSAGAWTTLALIERFDDIVGTPPDVRLRFISSETVLDITHRETTIGFRNRRPTEEGLAGRKLSRVEFAPYACNGAPDRWIRVLADTPSARWVEKRVGDDAVCEVNSPRNCLDLALAGIGTALLPTFIGDNRNCLRRTAPIIGELSHEQWLVTHQDDRHQPEVRRTIDRICAVMEGHATVD